MSALSDLYTLILRAVSASPLTTKGSQLTHDELDENFTKIFFAMEEILNGANVTAYDNAATYDAMSDDPVQKFALYDSKIWMAAYTGSPTSFSGQTPSEGTYWTQTTLAQMLGNPIILTKIAESYDATKTPSAIYETDWISSTEKNLNASPLTLIDASGDADIAHVPVGYAFQLDAGAAQFAFGTAPYIAYASTSSTKMQQVPTAQINSATDEFYHYEGAGYDIVFNDDVIFTAATDSASGTGTYWLKIFYKKVTKQF